MQARISKSAALATLLALMAPAISQAYDEAPGLPPAAPLPLSALPNALPKSSALDTSSLKVNKPAKAAEDDAFREKDVWGRIRSGYAIPDISNELVAKHVNWYAARPDYISRTTARASRYLFHVVTELEKRGMPTELALLPFIESAFNPQALSSANAAGMWQFVPGTGRDYNLKQDAFKDERRGVLASTDAALSYLQRLYDMFGDWQLALAAYNWGEGSVQKAIKRNQAAGKPTDFESLAELMPAETRNYVPKLQAVKNIIANPAQYGLNLPAIDNTPYFTAVDKTSDIDLTIAAHLAELSVDEFKALNPQFKRPVITGDEQTKILLPKENADKFHLNLAQWGKDLSTWTTHKITTARESIGTLASRFHTTPEVIRQANNIPQKTLLKAGSTILVPKISTSASVDISPEVERNATVAFEAERERTTSKAGYKLAKGGKAAKSGPVALVKARVSRDAVKGKHHKNRD
ncbi:MULTISPECIES: transglycosylase SLT domain-containing protein [unclassified Duganella]|uniref:transglycosylase SLT domain-containing protein n=1 Tax=unclassified Duganella TaxID=2636909 RepID=UPI000E34DB6D|nr:MULTISPECIES: transglycosylase SLT domain-containing protein [unclassified Duganella]RFP16079.1 LysM peptidoglycan-binding domain-containing protein [Duganella sp. BJB475]RFP32758.1 LysM peptidoglycan-binding domain-containing protein [Duganella sp. BJB476]